MPHNADWFCAYVEQILAPTLSKDNVVIMDDLGSPKRAKVRAASEATGASPMFLPASGPEFHPIEQAFAKLKALLQGKALRTVEAPGNALGSRAL